MTDQEIRKKALEAFPINNVRNSLGFMYDENLGRREGYIKALQEIEASPKFKGWVARDWVIGNFLGFFITKPKRGNCNRWVDKHGHLGGVLANRKTKLDPMKDVKPETGPVRVELIIRRI